MNWLLHVFRSGVSLTLAFILIFNVFPQPLEAATGRVLISNHPAFSVSALTPRALSSWDRRPFFSFGNSVTWSRFRPRTTPATALALIPLLSGFKVDISPDHLYALASIVLGSSLARRLIELVYTSLPSQETGMSWIEAKRILDRTTMLLKQSSNGWAVIEEISQVLREKSGLDRIREKYGDSPALTYAMALHKIRSSRLQQKQIFKRTAFDVALGLFVYVVTLKNFGSAPDHVGLKLFVSSLVMFSTEFSLATIWFTKNPIWIQIIFRIFGWALSASIWLSSWWNPLFSTFALSSGAFSSNLPYSSAVTTLLKPGGNRHLQLVEATEAMEALATQLEKGEELKSVSPLFDQLTEAHRAIVIDSLRAIGQQLGGDSLVPQALKDAVIITIYLLQNLEAPIDASLGARLLAALDRAVAQLNHQGATIFNPLSVHDLLVSVSLSAYTNRVDELLRLQRNLRYLPAPLNMEAVAYMALHQTIHIGQRYESNDYPDLQSLAESLEFLQSVESQPWPDLLRRRYEHLIGASTYAILPFLPEASTLRPSTFAALEPSTSVWVRRLSKVMDRWGTSRTLPALERLHQKDLSARVPFTAIRPSYGHNVLQYEMGLTPSEFLWRMMDSDNPPDISPQLRLTFTQEPDFIRFEKSIAHLRSQTLPSRRSRKIARAA